MAPSTGCHLLANFSVLFPLESSPWHSCDIVQTPVGRVQSHIAENAHMYKLDQPEFGFWFLFASESYLAPMHLASVKRDSYFLHTELLSG